MITCFWVGLSLQSPFSQRMVESLPMRHQPRWRKNMHKVFEQMPRRTKDTVTELERPVGWLALWDEIASNCKDCLWGILPLQLEIHRALYAIQSPLLFCSMCAGEWNSVRDQVSHNLSRESSIFVLPVHKRLSWAVVARIHLKSLLFFPFQRYVCFVKKL